MQRLNYRLGHYVIKAHHTVREHYSIAIFYQLLSCLLRFNTKDCPNRRPLLCLSCIAYARTCREYHTELVALCIEVGQVIASCQTSYRDFTEGFHQLTCTTAGWWYIQWTEQQQCNILITITLPGSIKGTTIYYI